MLDKNIRFIFLFSTMAFPFLIVGPWFKSRSVNTSNDTFFSDIELFKDISKYFYILIFFKIFYILNLCMFQDILIDHCFVYFFKSFIYDLTYSVKHIFLKFQPHTLQRILIIFLIHVFKLSLYKNQ